MDMQRALMAIVLSFLIMIGYQHFFVTPYLEKQAEQQKLEAERQSGEEPGAPAREDVSAGAPLPAAPVAPPPQAVASAPEARDITIDTPLYSAVISEQGGGVKSFLLKEYRRELAKDSGKIQLVQTSHPLELPLLFTLDNGATKSLPLYRADQEKVVAAAGGAPVNLVMIAEMGESLKIVRTIIFDPATYLVEQNYRIINNGLVAYQFTPTVTLTNQPFSAENSASTFMFSGAVADVGDEHAEVKTKDLAKQSWQRKGQVNWAGYEDNYFLCALLPKFPGESTVTMSAAGEKITTVIADGQVTLNPGEAREFTYQAYFGPKKLALLKEAGSNLSKAVNFGWVDILAKPMLGLLNFFKKHLGNYGIAIILLTILIKMIFWPIAQKGMKSMKNMQKIQPKVNA